MCHKLHLAIFPLILQQFSQSQWHPKALEKTFQSILVTSRGNQYWLRYQVDQQITVMDLAKQLSYYLYFFSFLFFSGLTTQGWSVRKYYMTKSHKGDKVTESQVTVM